MTVNELITELRRLDGDLEVWSTHPEWGIQWGAIKGVGGSITDQFQRVALIVTDDEEQA